MNSHDIMNEQVMVIALLVFLNSVKTSPDINIKCPSEKHWFLRAQSFCLSVKQYTCLLDYVNNVYKENCNGPKTEPPGDKTVINSGNFDTESCFIERFQPFSFSTLHGNDCIYNKAICTEEGQLIYSNGTNLSNRKCRCDYTKNFSFVSTNRVDICSCDPFIEDCSCHIKLCSKGQSVSPDYQCVKIEDSYGKFVCKDIEMQSIDSQTEKHKETIRAQIRKKVVQYVKSHAEIWRVCLTGIVVVSGILCIILILQRYEKTEIINTDQNTKLEEDKSKYRIHKATVEFYKDRPYEFTVLKDLIEDKTIEIYECNENTTEPNTPEIEEEKVLQNLFEDYKSEYIIRRKEVERNHATVMDELKKWVAGTYRYFTGWIGYKDTKKADILPTHIEKKGEW